MRLASGGAAALRSRKRSRRRGLFRAAPGALSFVIIYVIPRFAELYGEMNATLPALTVAVVNFALAVRQALAAVVLLLAGLAVGLVLAARSEAGARVLDRAWMRLPVVGNIIVRFRLAQFCRTLATLLAGGIPTVPSLEVSAGAMDSPVLRRAVETSARRVREGQSLHGALVATGMIPDLVTGMVEVGESTGALPHMLNSLAEFYEEELNAHLGALLALVEPLLLLGVARA